MFSKTKKGLGRALLFPALLLASIALYAYDSNKALKFGDDTTTNPGDVRAGDIMLDGNDILDENGTTRITVGATNAVTGNLTVSGTFVPTGNLTLNGLTIAAVDSHTIGSGTSTTPTSTFGVFTSTGGALSSSATPFIATSSITNGTLYIIQSATDSITVSDNGTVTDSCLELNATTRQLDTGDLLGLVYYSGKWYEMFFTDASSMNGAVGGTFTTGGDITIQGTTPSLTVGDAGEEDTSIVFDGNEQDYYAGLDDTDNTLKIGLGSAVGTTPGFAMNSSLEITAYAGFAPYSRTEAQLKVSTPSAAGFIFYDSTNKAVLVSTGTSTCFDYGLIYDGTTAPTGW